jgi:hypothetical protein
MAKIEIELTPKELEIFKDVLENFISDLRMEITDTDKQDYRESLKTKKNLIVKIKQKLEATVSAYYLF